MKYVRVLAAPRPVPHVRRDRPACHPRLWHTTAVIYRLFSRDWADPRSPHAPVSAVDDGQPAAVARLRALGEVAPVNVTVNVAIVEAGVQARTQAPSPRLAKAAPITQDPELVSVFAVIQNVLVPIV